MCSVSVSARWRLRACSGARRQWRQELHGLSAFGELKYPADFPHFAYVNLDAPKGGMFSQLVGSGRLDFQFAQRLYRKGRQGERDGAHFRLADGAGIR